MGVAHFERLHRDRRDRFQCKAKTVESESCT